MSDKWAAKINCVNYIDAKTEMLGKYAAEMERFDKELNLTFVNL